MPATPTHGVLFDVGYVLLDESRRLDAALAWLAPWLTRHGIPSTAHRLAALYAEACRAPDPAEPSLFVQMAKAAGADDALARRQRKELPWDAVPLDPFPDVTPGLSRLRALNVRLGVLANQPASARADLERAGILERMPDVWLSEEVGLAKPNPAFFRLALDAWGLPPERVTYVGDRPDNDVAPAKALGLRTVRLRVGPHASQPAAGPHQVADKTYDGFGEACAYIGGSLQVELDWTERLRRGRGDGPAPGAPVRR